MVDELRRKAEEQLNNQRIADDELSENDLRQVLQELRIHQIELELQNDELRRTQNELELSRQHYFELFNFAPIGYVVINKQGIIVQANLTVCQLLRVERVKLINKPLMLYLHSDFVTVFLSALEQSFQTRSTCEIQVRTKADVPQYLQLQCTRESDSDASNMRISISDISVQVLVRQELQQQTLQLNYAQSIAQVGSWWRDFSSDDGGWSDELYRLLGYQTSGAKRSFSVFLNHVHLDDREKVSNIVTNTLNTGSPFETEVRYVPNGQTQIRTARIRGFPTSQQSNSTILNGTFQDITHEKEIENNLRFINNTALQIMQYRDEDELLNYVGDQLNRLIVDGVIFIHKIDVAAGRIKNICIRGLDQTFIGRIGQLLGFSLHGHEYPIHPQSDIYLKGSRLSRFNGTLADWAGDAVPSFVANRAAKLANITDIYVMGMGKDGQLFADIQIYLRNQATIANPEVIETIIRQTSIAIERIRLEKALAESEAKFRTVVENFPNGYLILFDTNLRFVLVDGKGLLDKNDKARMENQFVSDEVHETIREEVIDRYQRVLSGECISRQIVEIDEQIFEDELIPIRNDINEIIGGLVIARNITEAIAIEERERQMILERERSEMLQTFVQTGLHEFRTPLTVIRLGAELIARYDDKEKRNHKAEQIIAQTEQVTNLLDMLIKYSVLHKTDNFEFEPIDIVEVVQVAFQMIKSRYGENCPTLSVESPQSLIIDANEEYLTEAIVQVLDNAVRHNPQTDEVRVHVKSTETKCTLQISDYGDGIDSENHGKIFTLFWRADDAHNTPGFGVGLSLTKLIIEKHGGTIDLVHDSQKGTSVVFRLNCKLSGLP